MGTSLSRRAFLTKAGYAAAGAAVVGLAGCAPQTEGSAKSAASEDIGTWDVESDIVVVGAGGAGLVAALEAARGGASVTILETANAAGGNTAISSGVIQAAGTDEQKSSAGITDDTPEKHAEFYIQSGCGQPREDLIRFACEQAPSSIEFMKGLGITYDTVYANGTIPYVDSDVQCARIHLNTSKDDQGNGYGGAHVAALLSACEDSGVEILYGSTGSQLVQNADGAIVGVVDEDGKRYRGKKAVILATCGYDQNAELAKMFSLHMTQALADNTARTVQTNLGQGIVMGMAVGASLDGMGGFIGLTNNIGATPTLPGAAEVPGIMVNRYGRRFVSESDHYAYVVQSIFSQENHEAWGIFDSKAAALGPKKVGSGVSGMGDDWAAEIDKGTVFAADSIEELAAAIGVNAVNLVDALNTWNADMATSQTDSQFPTRRCGLETIDAPPYYAMRCYDYNLGSLGGLKINTQAQVLDTNDNPIPHLYAAGQVAGGFMGPFYPGTGTGILSTLVFGRAAAENALKETEI